MNATDLCRVNKLRLPPAHSSLQQRVTISKGSTTSQQDERGLALVCVTHVPFRVPTTRRTAHYLPDNDVQLHRPSNGLRLTPPPVTAPSSFLPNCLTAAKHQS